MYSVNKVYCIRKRVKRRAICSKQTSGQPEPLRTIFEEVEELFQKFAAGGMKTKSMKATDLLDSLSEWID